MDKKGSTLKVIVFAIIALVLGGILYAIVVSYFSIGGDSVDRELCKDSVLLQARSKVIGTPLIEDLRCGTNGIEIDDLDENEIYSEIAGEMYDCWKQFGKGDIDFLDDRDWGTGNNWCFICSRIDFDESVQEKYPEIDGLFTYLKDEPLPLKPDETFFTYIYGDVSEDIDPQEFDYPYPTTGPFYVVFFGDKRFEILASESRDLVSIVSEIGGSIWVGAKIGLKFGKAAGVKGAIIGSIAGVVLHYSSTKTGYVSGLYVGPSAEMIERCRQ